MQQERYAEYYSKFYLTFRDGPHGYHRILLSKIDDSYAGFDFPAVNWLFDRGIVDSIQNADNAAGEPINIGYDPSRKIWFGWGNSRIQGFRVGSVVREGDVAYTPSNAHEFLQEVSDAYKNYNNDSGRKVTYKKLTNGINVSVGIVNRARGFQKLHKYPEPWGRGSWVASTLEDAKQMASDYARNVFLVQAPEGADTPVIIPPNP